MCLLGRFIIMFRGKEREKYHILSKDYDRMQVELKEAVRREKEILVKLFM